MKTHLIQLMVDVGFKIGGKHMHGIVVLGFKKGDQIARCINNFNWQGLHVFFHNGNQLVGDLFICHSCGAVDQPASHLTKAWIIVGWLYNAKFKISTYILWISRKTLRIVDKIKKPCIDGFFYI